MSNPPGGPGPSGAPDPFRPARDRKPTAVELQWRRVWKLLLVYGVSFAAAIAVVGAVVGYFVAGAPGVAGALIGAGMAAVFLGITALTMYVGRTLSLTGLAGALMAGFLFKAVLFLILASQLSKVDGIHGGTLFLTLAVAVIGNAIIDAVVVQRARISYVDPDATHM
ncbi:hypothetical protein LWF01_10055 [Saxibacter everestensis]|uniref:ATP synthase protein I n=1 Tax=Saxibacter everestensis TaxID=2909229 RepID=A0ABY8QNF1_9MICO|nr:hypothetical protein LWF01_10055 [Brevibacteriaceae bacterium ZFBP1038]